MSFLDFFYLLNIINLIITLIVTLIINPRLCLRRYALVLIKAVLLFSQVWAAAVPQVSGYYTEE